MQVHIAAIFLGEDLTTRHLPAAALIEPVQCAATASKLPLVAA